MQGLKDRGYTLHDNEAEQLVSHLDMDNSGQVDYLDWLAAMIDWHKVRPSHIHIVTSKVLNDKLKIVASQKASPAVTNDIFRLYQVSALFGKHC